MFGKPLSQQFWLVCAASIVMGVATIPERNTLTVYVQHIKPNKGDLKLVLFKDAEGFPDHLQKGFQEKTYESKSDLIKVQFRKIPEGEYALVVFQDENDDRKLNINHLGLPKEPFGCSENPRQKFHKVKFEEAKFRFSHKKHSVKIRLRQ